MEGEGVGEETKGTSDGKEREVGDHKEDDMHGLETETIKRMKHIGGADEGKREMTKK